MYQKRYESLLLRVDNGLYKRALLVEPRFLKKFSFLMGFEKAFVSENWPVSLTHIQPPLWSNMKRRAQKNTHQQGMVRNFALRSITVQILLKYSTSAVHYVENLWNTKKIARVWDPYSLIRYYLASRDHKNAQMKIFHVSPVENFWFFKCICWKIP